MLRGWKTYIAAVGLAATAVAQYMGHEIGGLDLVRHISEALALAGVRDVLGRIFGKG